ncbi:hypothetical protein J7384_17350 [Endozoicomonas sp. G2_1]|uniref:hypothetical protein n=1 Tax=Endozoicomonas sp. G2_1 TaxID=2821091 RepID=UPI001ADCAD5C|nr:hypothetical protein [Endozoicomonas sp. G2_1]MBO9492132.1 hypothetical protein [Endozoicomonas sp. G2_1]
MQHNKDNARKSFAQIAQVFELWAQAEYNSLMEKQLGKVLTESMLEFSAEIEKPPVSLDDITQSTTTPRESEKLTTVSATPSFVQSRADKPLNALTVNGRNFTYLNNLYVVEKEPTRMALKNNYPLPFTYYKHNGNIRVVLFYFDGIKGKERSLTREASSPEYIDNCCDEIELAWQRLVRNRLSGGGSE